MGMSKETTMTDRETLDSMLSMLGDLTSLQVRWDELLGKAQNGPPDGGADGTIDGDTWSYMQSFCRALTQLRLAQTALNRKKVAAAALAKLTPEEREALNLA